MNTPMAPSRSNLITRLVLVLLLVILGLWIASGFVRALLWAVIIMITVDPLYLRARARWQDHRHGTLLAALFTAAFALLVIIPVSIGIAEAAREAYEVAAWIASVQANGIPVPASVQQIPVVGNELAHWWQANLATPQGAGRQLHHLGGTALVENYRLIGSGLVNRTVTFAFTLIALFFLLRDRDAIIQQCKVASDRLLGATGERIAGQAILSVRGTIDGLVLVGVGEGVVMMLVYALLGVPHPIVLGVFTAVAAMIPFGAALLFVIAALLLLAQSAVIAAIAVIVIGLVVVGIADHFIRPVLIGGATRLPFLWVLIGILGGVETLGLLGLFIGPATMAVLMMLWREFQQDSHALQSSEAD
ncbi:AI-2E family transporter [soil metagenome]